MNGFLRGLQQPEYVHVLINPLPVYGLGIGLFAFIIAMLLRNRSAHIVALIVILVAAASAWPVQYFGDEAYDRVLSMTDEPGSAWLAAMSIVPISSSGAFICSPPSPLAPLFCPGNFPRRRCLS